MRTRVSVLTVAVALLAALALLVPGAALALGTLAGTTVNNSATVDYKVSTISQTQLISNTVSFNVDAKVFYTLTEQAGVWNTVTPGGATDTYYLTYLVTNDSNVDIDLDLNAFQAAGDDFDQTLHASTFYIDENNDSLYDGGDSLLASDFIDNLGATLSNTIFVVAAVINSPQPDGDIAQVILNATAYYNGAGANAGDGGACTGIVVADADGDNNDCDGLDWEIDSTILVGSNAIVSATGAFLVSSADLTVTKTSSLLWDPINLAASPIAIPGARISFTVVVSNAAAGATATDIEITDAIPGDLISNSDFTLTNTGTGAGTWTLTNAADGQEFGNAGGELTGGSVIVNGLTLQANDTATIIFQTYIK